MSEFRGKLHVFVDPVADEAAGTPKAESGNLFTQRAPGDTAWFLAGLAVGANPRAPYCSRTSSTKLRSFPTFATAMDFVRKRRKVRPGETFHLVYEVDGRKSVITSLEQIQQLDQGTSNATTAIHQPADSTKVEKLETAVGKVVAGNALELLKIYSEEGEEAARGRFSSATYARLWQALLAAGLVL